MDTQSASYGDGVIDGNNEVVSLEGFVENPNFDIGYSVLEPSLGRKYIYDNVEIEDISSDDEVDYM